MLFSKNFARVKKWQISGMFQMLINCSELSVFIGFVISFKRLVSLWLAILDSDKLQSLSLLIALIGFRRPAGQIVNKVRITAGAESNESFGTFFNHKCWLSSVDFVLLFGQDFHCMMQTRNHRIYLAQEMTLNHIFACGHGSISSSEIFQTVFVSK